MDDFLINGFVSFIGALVAVFIGVTLPRYFQKNDSLNEQKKWSKFFYHQILDISSRAKYPLDIEGGTKPVIEHYSIEILDPIVMKMQDEIYHLFSYDFTTNIEIYNYYKDKITLLNPERLLKVLKIYEIVFGLEDIKKNGIPDELSFDDGLSKGYIKQINSNLKNLVDPEILYELKKDF